VWFRKKDKAPAPPLEHTIPGQPRRHARTAQDAHSPAQAPALPAEALILTGDMREWLANDLERLESAAADNETSAERKRAEYERDLANAAHWRTIAAGYRRILDLAQATALYAEQTRLEREAAAYDAPPVPPDPAGSAATWNVPERVREADCGCEWWRGQSCEQCAMFRTEGAALWQPQAAWSGRAPNDGLTEPMTAVAPLTNGEVR